MNKPHPKDENLGSQAAPAAKGLWAMLRQVFKRFSADKGPTLAAALTFFTLLSIIPVMMVALAALGYILLVAYQDPAQAAQAAIDSLQKAVGQLLPGGSAVRAFQQFAEQANLAESLQNIMENSGITGLIGIVSLLWAAMQIFVNASVGMNAAFDVTESRSWVRLRLAALGLLLAAAVLFLLSLLPTSGPDFVRNLDIPWLGLPNPTPFWVDILFGLVAVAINVALFTLIYRFLPAGRTTWKSAFIGGLFMGILWEIAKKAFALYLANFGNYDKTYGALGGIILLVTWMYYTNILLLLGAEVAAVYARSRSPLGFAEPDLETEALMAVYEDRAVPLAASPSTSSMSPEEARNHARENVQNIKGSVSGMVAAVKHALWNIKTAPERNRAHQRSHREGPGPDTGHAA